MMSTIITILLITILLIIGIIVLNFRQYVKQNKNDDILKQPTPFQDSTRRDVIDKFMTITGLTSTAMIDRISLNIMNKVNSLSVKTVDEVALYTDDEFTNMIRRLHDISEQVCKIATNYNHDETYVLLKSVRNNMFRYIIQGEKFMSIDMYVNNEDKIIDSYYEYGVFFNRNITPNNRYSYHNKYKPVIYSGMCDFIYDEAQELDSSIDEELFNLIIFM